MKLSLLFFLALTPQALAGGNTLEVPAVFPTIQSAIDAALPGDTVMVADGVFSGAGNRDLRFRGKAITVRSVNGSEHTVIDCQGTPTEPYRGFIFAGYETRDSVLRGFTIMNGATLPGAIADQFNGGGVLIQASSPTIRDCRFTANHAGCWGGAIYAGDTHPIQNGISNPLIENCTFEANLADDEGGGFFTWGGTMGSEVTIRNSVFLGNAAGAGGGGICAFGGINLVLDHVTMIGNLSSWGGNAWLGQATITNSILWDGGENGLVEWDASNISYSLVQGGAVGVGNLDRDPGLQADGFHLLPDSPCIDAAAPGTGVGQRDIDGGRRRIGVRKDIGADEAPPKVFTFQ